MGLPNWPIYGKDLGSAVADVEKIVAKIKSNKFGKKDIIALYDANAEVLKAVISDDYEN